MTVALSFIRAHTAQNFLAMAKGLWLVLTLLYAAFLYWHQNTELPLLPEDVDMYINALKANRRENDGNDGGHDMLHSLRTLAKKDNGKEFYMVNLIKFRPKAKYPAGYEALGDDTAQANMRYNQAVVPELLRRGSYPVFAADVVGDFVSTNVSEQWDHVIVVRYRSRRDMLDMALALQAQDGAVHKWAAIEHTHIFPVSAQLMCLPLPLVVLLLFLVLGCSGQLLSRSYPPEKEAVSQAASSSSSSSTSRGAVSPSSKKAKKDD